MNLNPESFKLVGESPVNALGEPRKVFQGNRFFIVDSDGTRTDVSAYVGQFLNIYDDRRDYEGWKPDKE